MNCSSYEKFGSPLRRNALFEGGLNLHIRAKRLKHLRIWAFTNALVLALLLYDIKGRCAGVDSMWYNLEKIAAVICTLSTLVCFIKYMICRCCNTIVRGTSEQQKLLQIDNYDSSFVVTPKPIPVRPDNSRKEVYGNLSFRGKSFREIPESETDYWKYGQLASQRQASFNHCSNNASFNSSNDMSLDISMDESRYSYERNRSFNSPSSKYAELKLITDEKSLQEYLDKYAECQQNELEAKMLKNVPTPPAPENTFWNYCNKAVNIFKTSSYHLSPLQVPSTINARLNTDESNLTAIDGHCEIFKRISSEQLGQYVANLRMWISKTILQRLAKEIDNVNEMSKNRGFLDIQIGSVGLERLRKTVQNVQFVNQYMPTLPLILPFLEVTRNQEYLVQRIKRLANGSCIADYRWNSGSSFHGKKWDSHLPTDAALLFHFFCVYFDTQLMPLPQGCGRPFFSRYVILGDEKILTKNSIEPIQNKAQCGILYIQTPEPKFNFVSKDEIHHCSYTRNNLFYVILQFLLYMKSFNYSSLEGVNLGKSGINIMCVIED